MSTVFGWTYDKHNKKHRMFRTAVISVTSLICFVFAWWDISVLANSPAIPSPLDTWNSLVSLVNDGDSITGRSLWDYIGSSMKTYLSGFGLALLVAIPLGLVIGYFATIEEFASPVLEVLRPIAPIAWAPIFILAINYTVGPILVVFIGIFFPLLTNVIFGVKEIDKNLIDAARTLGANSRQIFTKVMIPSAVPYIMNGIKIGLGIGWMCIVAAELYAPQLGGIGFYLNEQATAGFWPSAFAAIVIIAVLGLVTTGVAEAIHKKLVNRVGMTSA